MLDTMDLKILAILQRDATLPVAEIGKAIGLSTTPCWRRMSGDVVYLMRVVVPDIAAYDAFYKRLIARVDIAKVSSAFAMEEIKNTTELPLAFAAARADA